MRYRYKAYQLLSFFAIVFNLLFASEGYTATYYTMPTEYEISSLPDYIEVRVRQNLGDKHVAITNANKRYLNILGPGYRHMHHYGYGLICLNRLYKGGLSRPGRDFNFSSALNEFNYVIEKAANTKLKILYEVWYKKGEVLLLQDKITAAIQSFNQSIKLKPDFFPSYSMLSICYQRLGYNKKAEEILELARKRTGKK